ncbi:MAG: Ig-like domain-containing protein [Bacteroidales bacterium]|nr:Ig-like domain-containing protein [Bacteroidales bacterium]
MIEVWGAGMLSYYYTAEGKDYYVSADVNYFGVTQWDGADLPAETILVVEEGSDLSGTLSEEGFYLAESELIGVPEWVNQSVWWKKKNPDGTNTTLFAKKKTCFLEELLSAALPSSQYGDQFTLVVMFDDGTSNGPQYNNSIEYYTVIDHRSVLVEYQLTFSAGDGGILSALVDGEAITSPAMLEEGTVVDFTATPDVNYVLEAWWLNGEVVDTIYLSIELEMWENNEIYLTFKLDVVGIEEIILSPPTATLTKGEQLQLTATVLPNNATNPDLLWSSSDPEVAIVDQSGLVTAFRPGKSLVRATAVGCGVLSTPSLIVVKEISPFSSQRSLYVEIEDLLGRKVPKNHPSIRMIKMIKMD